MVHRYGANTPSCRMLVTCSSELQSIAQVSDVGDADNTQLHLYMIPLIRTSDRFGFLDGLLVYVTKSR